MGLRREDDARISSSEGRARLAAQGQAIQRQAPGMEPVPTVSRRGLCVDLLVLEIKGIAEQRGSQLRKVNSNLMRTSCGDGDLQTITL